MAYDEEKFSGFSQMLQEAKAQKWDGVLMHNPELLGDDYDEVVENLNRLADAGLALRILPRQKRHNEE